MYTSDITITHYIYNLFQLRHTMKINIHIHVYTISLTHSVKITESFFKKQNLKSCELRQYLIWFYIKNKYLKIKKNSATKVKDF